MNCFGIDDALKLIWITFRSRLALDQQHVFTTILLMYQSDPHRSKTSGHVENKRRERTRRNKKPEYIIKGTLQNITSQAKGQQIDCLDPPNAYKI